MPGIRLPVLPRIPSQKPTCRAASWPPGTSHVSYFRQCTVTRSLVPSSRRCTGE